MPHRLVISVLCGLAFSVQALADDTEARYLEESRKTAQEFLQKLGGTLKSQLESAGGAGRQRLQTGRPCDGSGIFEERPRGKRVSLKPRNQALDPGYGKPACCRISGKPEGRHRSHHGNRPHHGRQGRQVVRYRGHPPSHACNATANLTRFPKGQGAAGKEYPDDRATAASAGAIRGAVGIKVAGLNTAGTASSAGLRVGPAA